MALINCPECKAEISDKAHECPHCGYKLNCDEQKKEKDKGAKRNKLVPVLIIVIAVLAILVIVLIITQHNSSGSNSKSTKTVNSGSDVVIDSGSDDSDGSNGFAEDEADNGKYITFTKDSEVKSETCSFTLTGYNIATKIVPSDFKGSYYHYYEAASGNVFVDVKFKMKNLTNKSMKQNTIVSAVTLIYDGEYEYDCACVTVDKDGDFQGYSTLYDIEALETMEYHMMVEVPEEVKSSGKSLVVRVLVDGDTYECTLRGGN